MEVTIFILFNFKVNVVKKEKAEERMHKLIVKGRKIMEHIMIDKKSKKSYENIDLNNGNDEFNMLYYDMEEN